MQNYEKVDFLPIVAGVCRLANNPSNPVSAVVCVPTNNPSTPQSPPALPTPYPTYMGGGNVLVGQNPCSAYPYIYNVYEDLEEQYDPTNPVDPNNPPVEPDCTNISIPFDGEYVTHGPLHYYRPNDDLFAPNPSIFCTSSNTIPPIGQSLKLSLVSFPFVPNLERTDALPTHTARILTISDSHPVEYATGMHVLSSVLFTNRAYNTITRILIPHSIYKHKDYYYCSASPTTLIDSLSVVVDNTRSRLRYYPFKGQNATNENMDLSTSNAEHDIVIQRFFELNDSFIETPPEGFSYLNYYPQNEAIQMLNNLSCSYPCFYPDPSYFATANPHSYLHPPPYSLLGFYIKGGQHGQWPAGYTRNSNGILTKQPGIKHTYIVDKNYDITQINPSERIFYNPEEVEIEADNLIFPSGYTFATVRGLPPKIDELPSAGQCPEVENLDPRYLPTDTDLPDRTYTFDNGTTVPTKASVYILKAGSKLTIQPCVYLYGVTFIVKEGATLIYYKNQTFGNYNIIKEDDFLNENDQLTMSLVIDNDHITGHCHDCRCYQTFEYNGNTEITTNQVWENRVIHINGKISITNNAKLEINNCYLFFADHDFGALPSGMIVEPRSKLIINNSKLTALSCHNMWEGIEVIGQPLISQTNESSHGVLQITNSAVENARKAIKTATFLLNRGGGIVKAQNTIFSNNDISFFGGFYNFPTISYFNNCVFEQTRALKRFAETDNPSAFAQAVYIFGQRLHFVNCTFQNTFGRSGIGIINYASDIYVGQPYEAYLPPPNPGSISNQSLIEGFAKGIDAYSYLDMFQGRTTIWKTKFNNNLRSYNANGTNLDQISESEFYMPTSLNSDDAFIFLHRATNYTIAGNIFQVTNPTRNIQSDGLGIVCHQTGVSGNRIFGNSFTSLYQGLLIEGNNSGLNIKCNNFADFGVSATSEYRYPWVLNSDPVLPDQGTGCGTSQTAGNLFYDLGQNHIYAAVPISFVYHSNSYPVQTAPITFGLDAGIVVIHCNNFQADPTTCPELPNINGYPDGTVMGFTNPADFAAHIKSNAINDTDLAHSVTNAVQHYLQNDLTQQQATAFLTALDIPQAWRMLLGIKLQQGDTLQAKQYRLQLSALPNEDPLLQEYYKLMLQAVTNGRSMYHLLPQEIATLEQLAIIPSQAQVYAQSLLAALHLETYTRHPEPIIENNKRHPNTSAIQPSYWLYPNPATHSISIHADYPWQTLTLYNLHGQVAATYYYTEQTTLPLPQNLQNGLYVARLTLTNGNSRTTKLLISK